MKETNIATHRVLINNMSHVEMARLYRFAPWSHMYFDTSGALAKHFSKRFKALGGMTSKVSKIIGREERK